MKNSRRAFALSILFLLLTVSSVSVFGQADRQTVVNIPFEFIIGDKTLPAGEYTIQRNWSTSNTTWTIRSKNTGATNKVFLTVPVQSQEVPERAKLVFHRYENLNFLTAFWTVGDNTGRELQRSDRERNLENNLLAKRENVVLISRAQ